jgi:hypothetical protein
MNHLKIKDNKHVGYVLLLIVINLKAAAHNSLTDFQTSINYNWAIPIGFIIGFAFFMLHAFLKQKDH